jgi:uncharacterized membrane protein YkgB
MSYEHAKIQFNPIKLESWERIGKFMLISIAIGIVISIVIALLILSVGSSSGVLTSVLVLGFVIIAQMVSLSWYEQWRGCHFKVEGNEGVTAPGNEGVTAPGNEGVTAPGNEGL